MRVGKMLTQILYQFDLCPVRGVLVDLHDRGWDKGRINRIIIKQMEKLTQALAGCFISPNVSDSNGEDANIVDVLNNIAKGIFKLADVIEKKQLRN